ncbi:DUF5995 family protein [Chitinophagaceae bacterium LWZ2-11]
MPLQTIDEVIAAMQQVIDECIKNNDRMGYFAALYHKVTVAVKEGIAKGEFEDGPRMDRFDVIFASRYLDALAAWKKKEQISASWEIAFNATKKSSYLILQQLLMGMNAHINLDLGIAAAQIAGDQPIENIHKDFNTINAILSSLTYDVLKDIDSMSPLLSLLGLHAGNQSSVLIQFSIGNARDGAWCFAEDLYGKKGTEEETCIHNRDKSIATLAGGLIHTTGVMRLTVWIIRLFEWHSPSSVIKKLQASQKKYFTVGETGIK